MRRLAAEAENVTIGYADLPPFKINVVEARFADPDEAERATPTPGVTFLMLAACAALAFRTR